MAVTYSRDGEDGDYIIKTVERENGSDWSIDPYKPYRFLSLSLSGDQIINDGSDTVAITIELLDGLSIVRETDVSVVSYDGDLTVLVDGVEQTKTLTNGSMSFELSTDKAAGSNIEVVAESLADHPAESDSAVIEVVKA